MDERMRKGQASHVQTVVFLAFLLMFGAFMLGLYDTSFCPESRSFINETMGNSSESSYTISAGNIISHAFYMRCSNVPSWVSWLFYTPIIIGMIYAVLPLK